MSLELHFVQDSPCPLLDLAYKAASDFKNLVGVKISEKDVLTITKAKKKSYFVFSYFKGAAFEHVKKLGMTILGPQVILHYIREGKPLPKWPVPLYSTALRHANVTVTSVTGEVRQQIYESIQMLHGNLHTNLNDDVNVVITPIVGSKKYQVAGSLGLHILMPEWIEEAWKVSSCQDPVDMLQETYTTRFRVPVFYKLVICVSGFSTEERKEIRDLIENNGGTYSGKMEVGNTTHLVVVQGVGDKYIYAKRWKMQIVTMKWLIDSVKNGYALDEDKYRLVENVKTGNLVRNASTPTRLSDKENGGKMTPDLSMISIADGLVTTGIDETKMTLSDAGSFVVPQAVTKGYFAGCKIAIYGGTDSLKEKFRKIITSGGGVLCSSLHEKVSEDITHVVIASEEDFDIDVEEGVKYVKPEWITECFANKRFVNEDNYLLTQVSAANSENKDGSVTVLDEHPKAEHNGELASHEIDHDEINMMNEYFEQCGTEELTERALETPSEPVTPQVKPLEGCVLSISGFAGIERKSLIEYAKELGAIVQDSFTRYAVAANNLLAATHLVLDKAEGKKYEASKKWAIPAVMKQWLKASAELGRRADVTDFLVDLMEQDETTFREATIREGGEETIQDKTTEITASVCQERPSNQRVRQLQFSESLMDGSPGAGGAAGGGSRDSLGLATPSKFLTKGVVYQPRFDLNALGQALKTPDQKTGKRGKPETPLTDLVNRALDNAVKATSRKPANTAGVESARGPLHGVVICVAKKLHARQVELNNIVKELGGDCQLTYDKKKCTHLIYESEATNEKEPELHHAKADGVHVVHPTWLPECLAQSSRVPEADYPAHLDVTDQECLAEVSDATGAETSNASNGRNSLVDDVSRRLRRDIVSGEVPAGQMKRGRRPVQQSQHTGEEDEDTQAVEVGARQADAHASQFFDINWRYGEGPGEGNNKASAEVVSPPDIITHPQKNRPQVEEVQLMPPPDTPKSAKGHGGVQRRASLSTRSTDLDKKSTGQGEVDGEDEAQRVFLLSSVTPEERDNYTEIVLRLGGVVSETNAVTPSVTHLIATNVSRSEKFMACVASGKWILHKSYLDACNRTCRWVSEEGYEWGGPGTEPMLATLGSASARDVAKAARKWRQLGGGAFTGWKVVLAPGSPMESSFKRLIDIGGGQVLASATPYPPVNQVTHAFVDGRHAAGIDTLPTGFSWTFIDYLAAFLVGNPSPPTQDFAAYDGAVNSPRGKRVAPGGVDRGQRGGKRGRMQ